MCAWKRWLLDGALLLAGLIALAYASLYFMVPSQRSQQRLQAEVVNRSGYEIQPGDLRLIPPFRFVASAVVLSKSGHPLLQAERVSFTLSFFDLLSRTLTRIEFKKPTLRLDLKELFQAPSQSSLDMAVRHLNIDDGTVVLTTGEGGRFDFRSATMNADNLNLEQHSAAGNSENQTHLRSELDRTGETRLVDPRCTGKLEGKTMEPAGN